MLIFLKVKIIVIVLLLTLLLYNGTFILNVLVFLHIIAIKIIWISSLNIHILFLGLSVSFLHVKIFIRLILVLIWSHLDFLQLVLFILDIFWLGDSINIFLNFDFLIIYFFISRSEIKLQSYTVVTDGEIKLAYTIIAAASIKISICILGIYFYNPTEIFNCFFIKVLPLIGDASVMKGMYVCEILLYYRSVVYNCLLISAQFCQTIGSIVVGFYLACQIALMLGAFLVLNTVFYLVRVVLYCKLVSFKLPIHKPSV